MSKAVKEPTPSRDQPLNCLFIQQPYASLIAFGRKRWEFRSYETKKRGRIGIAASPGPILATRNSSLDAVSHLFPRGVLLATANLVNCFYATAADLKKAMRQPMAIDIHGHEIFTLDSPIGEPQEDVEEAISSNRWESYVWELDEVEPLLNPIPVEKEPRLTWGLVKFRG